MFSEILLGAYTYLPKNDLFRSGIDMDVLRQKLTVVPAYDNKVSIPAFFETAKYFGLPRYYRSGIESKAKKVRDFRSLGSPITFSMKSELRDIQKPLFDSFIQAIELGKTGILLQAGTGLGKTVLLLNYLQKLGRTALVIVPRANIVEQWVERILEHTDIKEDEIGIARQDRCDFEGKKIVIGLIHSVCKDKYGKEFKKWPGVLAVDEVHVTGAETFSKVLGMFSAKFRLGASATPERQDKMDALIHLHLAEHVIQSRYGTYVKPKVFIREYREKKAHPYLATVHNRMSRRGMLISRFAEDFTRNVLIAVYVSKCVASDRRTLVLSDRKEQLESLYHLLTARHGMLPVDVGIYTHSTKKKEKVRILNKCKVILATYGVMSMAVDVPDLRALVFGTPMSEVEQAIGRILRLCEGTKEPVVFDIVDTRYTDSLAWANNRRMLYAEKGFEIVEVKAV